MSDLNTEAEDADYEEALQIFGRFDVTTRKRIVDDTFPQYYQIQAKATRLSEELEEMRVRADRYRHLLIGLLMLVLFPAAAAWVLKPSKDHFEITPMGPEVSWFDSDQNKYYEMRWTRDGWYYKDGDDWYPFDF